MESAAPLAAGLTIAVQLGFGAGAVVSIWLIPFLEQTVGWRWAFSFLALGPLAGLLAMRRLRALPGSAPRPVPKTDLRPRS